MFDFNVALNKQNKVMKLSKVSVTYSFVSEYTKLGEAIAKFSVICFLLKLK